MPPCGAAPPCATSGFPRERRMRNRAAAFAAQSVGSRAGTLCRWLSPPAAAFAQVALSLATNLLRGSSLCGRRKLDTRSPRLRQTDSNGLLGRSSAVFAFAYVLNFLANEFARLCRGRFTLLSVAMRTLDYIFLCHVQSFRETNVRDRRAVQRCSREPPNTAPRRPTPAAPF